MNSISQIIDKNKDFLTPSEAAEMLGVKVNTLAVWRCKHKKKIPFYKIGRAIKYKNQDLLDWIESQKVN